MILIQHTSKIKQTNGFMVVKSDIDQMYYKINRSILHEVCICKI